jgi:D-alanyl-lipoteichoic acid acyltransferase DltB (MBOAT superfamily)
MLFDSPAYFVFLIPVVLAYWRLNRREQNVFLLLASYFFYGWWDWRFLALMIGRKSPQVAQTQTAGSGLSSHWC